MGQAVDKTVPLEQRDVSDIHFKHLQFGFFLGLSSAILSPKLTNLTVLKANSLSMSMFWEGGKKTTTKF